jgi:uncharacterized membrane protein YoaK (UPF0700 family)
VVAGGAHVALIAIAAAAMGLQSAAVLAADTDVSTTYVSGTLTRAIAGAVGEPPDVTSWWPAAVWLVYALGAAGGVFAQQGLGARAMAIPLALVCLVTVAVAIRTSGRGAPRPPGTPTTERPQEGPTT